MNNVEEEQVEAMTTALEVQLSIVYPRGPNFSNDYNEGDDNNEKMTTEDEGTLRNSFQNLIQDLNYSADYHQLKVAFARAVHRWKSNSISNGSDQMTDGIPPQKTKTSTTFSLFDQLQGGFALPVTLEEIQEASSAQERFKLFERIDYVDDLLMDWKEICHILTTDLFDSSQADDPELGLQIISLHRKWFDQGRSSDEYTPLLYNICQNLLETLGKVIKVEEKSQKTQHINRESHGLTLLSPEKFHETLIVSLVQNWRDMWLDLMQRNQYSEDLAQDMETCMIMIYLQNAPSKKSALAQKVLALVDPNARWFQSWMNDVATIDHLISLLCMEERDSIILSELWIRIQTFPEEDNNENPSNYAFQLHSISIISITLCRTRLSHFPWDVINQKNTCTENFTTIIDEMLDLFLRVVVSLSIANNNTTATNNDFSNELMITILNGVEAILEGSRRDNNSDFERRFGTVRSILQQEVTTEDKTITRFLNVYIQ